VEENREAARGKTLLEKDGIASRIR
jgi:hypothetical protein